MRIVYAPRALRDIDEILSYTSERSPRGAHAVSRTIEHTIQRCALTPRASPRTDEPVVHRCPPGKYRYTIFYRMPATRQEIEVIRVIHSARIKSLRALPDLARAFMPR